MQIAADAVSLLDDREVRSLLVEPGVVDRDPGVEGEQLDQPLIVRRELGSALFIGEIEVPDGSAA